MNDSVYKSHEVRLTNRNILKLTGIKKVLNFDKEEFEMISSMGNIIVKGRELEVILLDTDKGDIEIKGRINSISYLDAKSHNKESLFTKLFK